MHRVHAETCEREASEVVREHAGRGVRTVLLSADVVSRMHEQVVRQSPESAGARDMARWPHAVPNVPRRLLHARHIHGHVTSSRCIVRVLGNGCLYFWRLRCRWSRVRASIVKQVTVSAVLSKRMRS